MLKLRRITTSSFYLAELDGLRFLAIMPVVYAHSRTFILRNSPGADTAQQTLDLSQWIGYFLTFGVPLFYCISGFILSLPFARYRLGMGRQVKVLNFYKRRLTRLEPPYILSLTVFFFVHLLIMNESFGYLLPRYIASFFYMHNIAYGEWSVINPVAWTLEIEFQFYLLAPFISLLIFRLSGHLRVAVIIALMLFFVGVEAYLSKALAEVNLDRTIITKAQYFLAGFLCCHLYLNDSERFTQKSYLWDFCGFSAFLISGYRFMTDSSVYVDYLTFTFAIVLFFLAGFRGKIFNRIMSLSFVSIVGGMCYSIYLLHYPLIHFLGKFFQVRVVVPGYIWVDVFLYVAVYTTVVLAVCTVFYVLIERPCMDPNWPRQLKAYLRRDKQ